MVRYCFLFFVLLLLSELLVEHFCILSGDKIDDGPDGKISQNKNDGKDQDRCFAQLQPIVEEIGEKVGGIQNDPVDQDGAHKGQTLKLIDDIHAPNDKRKAGQRKDPQTDLFHAEILHGRGLMHG